MSFKLARKPIRLIFFPFAILFAVGVIFRNWLYNLKIFRSTSFGLPLICVGNLALGGTGKSPMVEYLVRLLRNDFKVATLSRGYKRKTKGYTLANPTTTALEIGDEPMQFHSKFPEIPVAVGEQRLEAIPQILHDRAETQVIILDDAFQHRAVKAGLNILLTEQYNLFTQDYFAPVGQLRDQRVSAKRAQAIVVTKCDPALTEKEKEKITREIRRLPSQQIFFTSFDYGRAYHINSRQEYQLSNSLEILLVTGIANPRPLQNYIAQNARSYFTVEFADHHIFTIDDLKKIRNQFREIKSSQKIILTTEKDAVRLVKFNNELADLPLYVIPVQHRFLFGEQDKFDELVINFIKNFKSKASS